MAAASDVPEGQLNRTRKCNCCGGQRQYVVVHPVTKEGKATAWAVCESCDLTPQSSLPGR